MFSLSQSIYENSQYVGLSLWSLRTSSYYQRVVFPRSSGPPRPTTSACLLHPAPNLGHQQPADALRTKQRDHRRLNHPDALLRAQQADDERPERAPALADGTHDRKCVRVHRARDEAAPGGDRGGVERGDRDADEGRAHRRRREHGHEPCDALEGDREKHVDDDCRALAHEDVQRREEDPSEGDACEGSVRKLAQCKWATEGAGAGPTEVEAGSHPRCALGAALADFEDVRDDPAAAVTNAAL